MFKKLFSKFKKEEIKPNIKEPYFKIVGERIDPEYGLIMEYDWNDEFIQYLKNAGFTGTTEDIIVEKWLKSVFYDVIQRENKNEFF